MNFFQKFREFISQPTHKRTLGIVIMLVLAATVSLTVVLSQQQQTIRQRAAEPAEQLAKGYVLCGDGLQQCQNGITVNASCDEGKSKCLSSTANFSGSDRINGKSLTCCLSDRYREVDGVCTLVRNINLPPDDDGTENCSPPTEAEEPKESDYPLCWGGSRDVPALTGCEPGVAVNTPCSEEGFSKCLSIKSFIGADRIDGKYLTCCKAKEYGLVNDKCTLVADGEYSSPTCNPESRILPTLSIDPASIINEGGDLNFSFTGFDPGEQVTVMVVGGGSITVKAGSDSNGKSLIPGLTEPAGKYTLKATGGSSGQSATAEFEIIATPILTIDPAPITTGGNLKYSFSGFQPGEIIEVWVNKRGENGVNNRTGGIVNPTTTDGNGDSIIYGLTEPAGKYTLSAKGVSSERFTTAEFDISSSAHVLPKLNSTSIPASKLAPPTGYIPPPTPTPTPTLDNLPAAFDSLKPPPPCILKSKGDANCDDKITIVDFNVWKDEFTRTKTTKTADFNGDKKITIADLNVWKDGFADASLQH